MTQPAHDPNALPPEGYYSPAEPPKQGQQYSQPAGPQQPYGGQQPGYPAGPQQPYGGQQPGYPYGGQQPYQGYPPSPQQYQPGQPMPNPAYGYPQPKSKIAAGLLGIFLGGLGIHRFYLGFTKIAVIQLVLTIVLGVFTFGLVGLWGVVEGIMIIV
ncbi:NINE protein [Pseudarthrobacter sp. So.54]